MSDVKEKICTTCKISKPVTRDHWHFSNGRPVSRCRPCANEDCLKRWHAKEKTPEQKALAVARTNQWRLNNPEQAKALDRSKSKTYRARWPEKARAAWLPCRAAARTRKTGWTPDAVDAAWIQQSGKCEICSTSLIRNAQGPGKKSNTMTCDHDHSTNKPRGLLCNTCNIGFGHFEREPDNFIRYRNKYSNKPADPKSLGSLLKFVGIIDRVNR
jgi:hypothetical protein